MNKISVILPTYKGASKGGGKYLKQAIESVLNQTYENFELIIINDGSTDNTEEIIKAYKDIRIIYLKHNTNKGPSAARNTGIKKATGEYIAFLDDDDYYYSTKLAEQLEFMLAQNSLFSFVGGILIDVKGELIKKTNYQNVNDPLYFFAHGLISCYPDYFMVKKEFLMKIGLFKEHLIGPEDFDLCIRLAIKCKPIFLNKLLVVKRIHTSNLSINACNMCLYELITKYELKEYILKYFNNSNNKLFFDLFHRYMKASYKFDNLKQFQKFYRLSSVFGRPLLEWKIKYYLSFFPMLTKILYYLKLKKIYNFLSTER